MHNALTFEAMNEGHEQLPLQAPLVQLGRMAVRGCNNRQSLVPEASKQALQNDSIRHISHE
jgi:hypothetical protein